MKVEMGFEDGRRRKGGDKPRETGDKVARKKECRKPRRRVHAPSFAIQRLFETCKAVFKGPGTVPSPVDVRALEHLLDRMRAEDVGLNKELSFFKPTAETGTPRITCTTIYKCENFSMCIFFLPATAVIPLHNHPGMTVFSKLLLGSMHIKSYDWVEPTKLCGGESDDNSSPWRLARLKADSDFTAPCNTAVLYPTSGGNMHTFRAITPCLILDVLGPPYSTDEGRDSSYYRDHPCSSTSQQKSDGAAEADAPTAAREVGRYGWLEEIHVPSRLMDPVPYLGPQIIDI